ncbi:MAG: formylglycine-generating enzyme family protein, partial [Rhodospirillales bacterium]
CLEYVAWYAENSESMTHPVGQKGDNGFGLYDMHGNVWEWVEDCKQSYSSTPTDGSAQTGSNTCIRVLRGGSWYNSSGVLRAANRGEWPPSYSYNVLGFRLARTLAPAPAPSGGTNKETLFWQSIQAGDDIESYEAYLSRYPKGTFAALARVKIDKLKQQKQLAAPPKPPASSPVKPAVGVFPKKAGQVFRDCADCPEMVVIAKGSFRMGDLSGGGDSDEKPVHRVTIPNAFAVGKYEVTFTEWDACVSAGGCNGLRPKDRGWGRDSRPVINVSWNDAKEYVGWLSRKTGQEYRIPSESEWEYAARAGTGTKWSCGNKEGCLGGVAWYAGNSGSRTHPVGQKGANGFGLYDMHGNVWEWVEDCKQSYSGTPTDGSAQTGSNSCDRVSRGGFWDGHSRDLRAADRDGDPPDLRDGILGFRLARTL